MYVAKVNRNFIWDNEPHDKPSTCCVTLTSVIIITPLMFSTICRRHKSKAEDIHINDKIGASDAVLCTNQQTHAEHTKRNSQFARQSTGHTCNLTSSSSETAQAMLMEDVDLSNAAARTCSLTARQRWLRKHLRPRPDARRRDLWKI
jgi:hypothetical protein